MAGELRFRLVPGDVYLDRESFVCIVTPQGARWRSLGWRVTTLNSLDLLDLLKPPRIWHPGEESRNLLETMMNVLLECWHGTAQVPRSRPNSFNDPFLRRKHDDITNFTCRSLGAAILGHCWQWLGEAERAQISSTAPAWLTAALKRLAEEPAVNIAKLAHDVGFSPAQFRRSFRTATGFSPRDYQKEQRLQLARQLLETTDLPIGVIAQRLGYKNASHFIRLWQQTQGLSPTQHRTASKIQDV